MFTSQRWLFFKLQSWWFIQKLGKGLTTKGFSLILKMPLRIGFEMEPRHCGASVERSNQHDDHRVPQPNASHPKAAWLCAYMPQRLLSSSVCPLSKSSGVSTWSCFVNWLLLFNGQQCSWDHRWSVATTIAEDQETLSSVCYSSVAEFYVIKLMILFSSGFVWFSKTVFQSISHQTKGLNTLPSGAKATFLGLTVPIWPPSPTLNIINKIPQNECRSKTRLRFKVWNI